MPQRPEDQNLIQVSCVGVRNASTQSVPAASQVCMNRKWGMGAERTWDTNWCTPTASTPSGLSCCAKTQQTEYMNLVQWETFKPSSNRFRLKHNHFMPQPDAQLELNLFGKMWLISSNSRTLTSLNGRSCWLGLLVSQNLHWWVFGSEVGLHQHKSDCRTQGAKEPSTDWFVQQKASWMPTRAGAKIPTVSKTSPRPPYILIGMCAWCSDRNKNYKSNRELRKTVIKKWGGESRWQYKVRTHLNRNISQYGAEGTLQEIEDKTIAQGRLETNRHGKATDNSEALQWLIPQRHREQWSEPHW